MTPERRADLTLEQAQALLLARESELAELRAAHEDFLRAVSHDLRAPLRHITSYGPLVAELLQDCGLQGEELQEAQGFLATMDQSARRMGRMLDGLLALSRIARAPLQRQPVALADLVAQAQAAVAPLARGRAVAWQIATAAAVLHGDPALLRQLLTELLGNALKFTPGRAPARIAIGVERSADGTGATLSVQDNGVGFDAAQAAGLFGVFQRLHRETEFEGVGAGLAAVRAIARRHGGEAQATAALGAGCTVRVRFPG
ncbi:ATP-binding protein [Acidovorax sp. SRB_24]|uniref:sensor histidine kinase n=1 Tax=Acidovorax sp. SRB_24 TaxID=1962700 RepID=UPI00145E3893|nr:ATP-binding protein [Acidovorax sp. SRB_24]NMM77614.1 two-component sensor histidine kinase [Acidovorax sp. SRB_24]